MNVLFLSSWYPNKYKKANGDFVQRHAQTAALTCNVFVFHVCFHPSKKKSHFEKKHAHGITEIIYYTAPLKFLKSIQLLCIYVTALKKLRKQFGFVPTIVHANVMYPIGVIALLYKFFWRIPYVISEHWSAFIFKNPKKIKGFPLFMCKRIARNAKYIMPVSNYLKKNLITMGLKGHYHVVGNVVNTTLFSIKPPPPPEVFKFIHISSTYDKNTQEIIDAANLLSFANSQFEIHIISPEELHSECKQVHFHGILPHAEIAKLIQKSHCLVHFSNFETFSIVVAESLACGKPVITTRAGGLCDEITENEGIIVHKNDINGLAVAMQKMTRNHAHFDPENLRKRITEHYSPEKIAAEFLAVYEKSVR